VLLHGVHRLGIDEPRLVRFARTIAASGVSVVTPELGAIADYRVDASSVPTIEAAVRALRAETRRDETVGLMGMSFAGGLALLAAADPACAPDVDYVVSVGAHDDLARVSRFFVTNTIARPDGSTLAMHAHGYGVLVFVYAHAESFFAADDVPGARDALRAWLWEERDAARAKAALLPPVTRGKLEELFEHDAVALAPEILSAIDHDEAALARVSPRGHVAGVRAPVYLLHGAEDSVIPPSEALWLAEDLPRGVVRDVLVTRAIGHVELGAEASWRERWGIVHFMAEVMGEMTRAK
jgi:pimeloyl-ACP methyl ester carboxylesterase